MDAAAHFGQLARYNVWATERLLRAVDALPEADYRRDLGLFFRSIHGTLSHLLVGEHLLWFVRFAEGSSPRVALDAEDLDRPVQTADPALAHLARRQLDRLLEERGATSTEDRVRELAVVLLPMGRCTIEQVALHLGVHRRTLHRHLERQGLLFGDLVQQVRKDQARKLMRSPERPLTQVSELLGFSSPPAFSRWHRRQFGETAVAHQRRLQAEPPVKPTGQTRP